MNIIQIEIKNSWILNSSGVRKVKHAYNSFIPVSEDSNREHSLLPINGSQEKWRGHSAGSQPVKFSRQRGSKLIPKAGKWVSLESPSIKKQANQQGIHTSLTHADVVCIVFFILTRRARRQD